MPNKPKTTKTRKTMKRRPYKMTRKGVLNKRKTDNYATIEETISANAIAGNTYNTSFNLGFSVRAQALAKQFQYYRITSIVYRFKPNNDTYVAGSGNNIPHLYFLYDRSNTLPALTAPQFEQLGAKPIRMDDKTIVKYLKPAVLDESSGNLPATTRISPWLPCNSNQTGGYVLSDVDHFGNVFYISKINAGDAQPYDIDITITVQYKAPLVAVANGEQFTNKQNLVINPMANVVV